MSVEGWVCVYLCDMLHCVVMMAVCKDCYPVYLLIAVIVGPFQMRLNGVTNCGELKVRHLSLKKPLL